MFNTQNFIVPVGTDNVLKLRNTSGMVAHIIRDLTCTIKQEESYIYIKQMAESNTISLEFQTASEAALAHTMLRDAIASMTNATGIYIITSTDFKNELADVTLYDGDDSGVSALSNHPIGPVGVNVNSLPIFVGDGCTNVTFSTPVWDGLFGKKYTVSSYTTNTLTLPSVDGISINDYVIVKQTTTNFCYRVTAVNTTTNTITVHASTVAGTVTKLYKVKKWNNTESGDFLLWFGSYAGYELSITDNVIYNYFKAN